MKIAPQHRTTRRACLRTDVTSHIIPLCFGPLSLPANTSLMRSLMRMLRPTDLVWTTHLAGEMAWVSVASRH